MSNNHVHSVLSEIDATLRHSETEYNDFMATVEEIEAIHLMAEKEPNESVNMARKMKIRLEYEKAKRRKDGKFITGLMAIFTKSTSKDDSDCDLSPERPIDRQLEAESERHIDCACRSFSPTALCAGHLLMQLRDEWTSSACSRQTLNAITIRLQTALDQELSETEVEGLLLSFGESPAVHHLLDDEELGNSDAVSDDFYQSINARLIERVIDKAWMSILSRQNEPNPSGKRSRAFEYHSLWDVPVQKPRKRIATESAAASTYNPSRVRASSEPPTGSPALHRPLY